MDSILTSIKKLLGIEEDYEHFDQDIIVHINSVFFILNQLGVNPSMVFSITDKTKLWSEYLVDNLTLEIVKSYVYLKVRLIFDPPTSSSLLEAMKTTVNEFEWRIMTSVDPKIVEGVLPDGE